MHSHKSSTSSKSSDTDPHPRLCPRGLRYFLLAALSIHLLAVLAEPLRFFSRTPVRIAPEFDLLRETLKPYSQWLYLDHGYFFFAPNPGPSHLIQCTLDPVTPPTNAESNSNSKGVPTVDSTSPSFVIPNRKKQWPRLLYHRYFMLSEFYNSRFAPQNVAEEDKKDPELMARWTFDRDLYVQIQSSIIKSILHSTGAKTAILRRLERALPDADQILREGWRLDDPRLLEVLSESIQEETAAVHTDELPSKVQVESKP